MKTFIKLGKKYEDHIFGDEWKSKVGGRRKGRSSKKDRYTNKEKREWCW